MGLPTFLQISEYSGSVLENKLFLSQYEWTSLIAGQPGPESLDWLVLGNLYSPGSVGVC